MPGSAASRASATSTQTNADYLITLLAQLRALDRPSEHRMTTLTTGPADARHTKEALCDALRALPVGILTGSGPRGDNASSSSGSAGASEGSDEAGLVNRRHMQRTEKRLGQQIESILQTLYSQRFGSGTVCAEGRPFVG